MSRRPEKHSLTLRGHRTSVSLETEFWAAFRNLAHIRRMGINELAAEIDEARGDRGLASAIRVEVLRALQDSQPPPGSPGSPALSSSVRKYPGG